MPTPKEGPDRSTDSTPTDQNLARPNIIQTTLELELLQKLPARTRPVVQEALWLCQTPHPSGHESALLEKIMKRAHKEGYGVMQDQAGNVAIDRPGRGTGKDKREGIILQGHIDMVPDVEGKTVDEILQHAKTIPVSLMSRSHLFSNGEQEDVLCARGTSFGDCLIGNSVAMEALFGNSVKDSPPLRVIFTVGEEISLQGARSLDPKLLLPASGSDISYGGLLNLDIGNPNAIRIGGGGSSDCHAYWTPNREPIDTEKDHLLEIELSNLAGGHSGLNIHEPRANAIKELLAVLSSKKVDLKSHGVRFSSLAGGNARGSIAASCTCGLWCPKDQVSAVKEKLFNLERWDEIREGKDSELKVEIQTISPDSSGIQPPVPVDETENLLYAMAQLPSGVKTFYEKGQYNFELVPGMELPPLTSTNIGTVTTFAGGKGTIKFHMMTRSDRSEEILKYEAQIASIIENGGGRYEQLPESFSSAWTPDPAIADTPFFRAVALAHKETTGLVPRTISQHSGLEPGVIAAKNPGLKAIAIGAFIGDHHSHRQWVTLKSITSLHDRVVKTLETLASK